jgi:hypothetical protein
LHGRWNCSCLHVGIPQQIKEETLKRIPEEFKDILNMI